MPLLEALFLGVLQGLTEFWPISSSAHLTILPKMLHWESPLLNSLVFDVALHGGTLLAVLLYFREDLWDLTRCWFKDSDDRVERENRRMGRRLILATIPAVVAALLLDKYVENIFRSPLSIAWALILGGVVMGGLDRMCKQSEELFRMRGGDAFLAGLLQAVALIPGVSRSGAALTALRLLKFRRPDAARFTFLMSIPIIFGAVLYEGHKIVGHFQGGEWAVLARESRLLLRWVF